MSLQPDTTELVISEPSTPLGRMRLAVMAFVGVMLAGLVPPLADQVISFEESRTLVILGAGNALVWLVPLMPASWGWWRTVTKAAVLGLAAVAAWFTLSVYGDGVQAGEVVQLTIVGLTAMGLLAADNDPPVPGEVLSVRSERI